MSLKSLMVAPLDTKALTHHRFVFELEVLTYTVGCGLDNQ